MKKSLNFILILPLLLAIGFVLIAIRTGSAPDWFATPISTPTYVKFASSTPLVIPSVDYKQLTATKTRTRPPTLTLTPTHAVSPTSTATSVHTPTLTMTPASTPDQLFPSSVTGTPASTEINEGIAIGNQIVRAIEVYNLDQGHYPPTLDDLVPVYLSEIPLTTTGQQYFYRPFDSTDPLAPEIYWLAFRVAEQQNVTCTYLRRLGYWDCNFASP